jgi:hypothetical protein
MKVVATVAILFFVPVLAYGDGPKPCEVLKTEIAAKLDAHGSKGYTLEIVAKDKEAEGKVVGTCDAGSKKIVYSKAAPPSKAADPAPKKP